MEKWNLRCLKAEQMKRYGCGVLKQVWDDSQRQAKLEYMAGAYVARVQ